MISKSDIILLLTELQEKGLDVSNDISNVYYNDNIPLDILKKINSYKCLDVVKFYEKIRSSYNNKKSKLYINIMKSDENAIKDATLTLTTLSSLLNQILLYKPEDKVMFLKHSRANEIAKVLSIYTNNFNIEPAYKLLQLYKADIKVLQSIM